MNISKELYNYYVIDRVHRGLRKDWTENLAEEYAEKKLSPEARMTDRFVRACAMEIPAMHKDEKIVFRRSIREVPDIFTEAEWADLKTKVTLHEAGFVSNLSPNYAKIIAVGFEEAMKTATPAQKTEMKALLELTERYRKLALEMGKTDVAQVLAQVPMHPARNFREALQFFRILHYSLWLEGEYHNTVGRFDQYMYPYFKKDMDAGVYTREEALTLVEDFFLSFNKDSDLYRGVQQGDNGQSMVLGGRLNDGSEGYNLLSELCLEASEHLKLIDPKINLRVNKNTPIEVYEKGTKLTRVGLGFPQYSNDDIVIPGLVRLGYEEADAVNYVVAACWEFIIPGVGDDIANIGAVNFPEIVRKCTFEQLKNCADFPAFRNCVLAEINKVCDGLTSGYKNVWFVPAPMMDLLRDERKYHNYGLHGTGIATAADSLTAIRTHIFEKKDVTVDRLLTALDSDFAKDPELLHLLRFETPKMGQDDDDADENGKFIISSFGNALEGKKNDKGGVWRAGTGTAMYYLWHARDLGATPDGRRKGEPFGTNYSPNLFAQIPGPVSDIASFTKPDLTKTMNGGPLTLEFASGIFRNEESIGKVARLIQYFVQRGGHQLQLNAVNPEMMKDAQIHPEAHQQLVVRIWGWSAYFVELDKDFQDHVLARQEYSV